VIERARAILGGAERVCAFSGAGLSAESGVPTFRDAATDGLWTKHDPMRLASPEGFAEDPIQLHGTLTHDRCHAGCGYRERIDLDDPPEPRNCAGCGAPMRPAVVWFGESLPADAWVAAEHACRDCDVLLVVGTSAEVYPAAGLIHLARAARASIIVVNTNPSAASAVADVEVIGKAGEVVPEILIL
jgi:NAD-dependent deacetylase